MEWDYGDRSRGIAPEHFNLRHALELYAGSKGWGFLSFDFAERGSKVGQQRMTDELFDLVIREQPAYLFAIMFAPSHDPRYSVFPQISSLGCITIHWFMDDSWRFEDYSSVVAPHFDYVCTSARCAVPKYEMMGLGGRVIKTQGGCSEDIYIPLNIKRDIDISFVGQNHGNRAELISQIIDAGFNVQVFGRGWSPNSQRVSIEEMVKIFNRSKINLNFSNASVGSSTQVKGRTFEIMGTRSFQLCGNADGIDEYYVDGDEIVIFFSAEDLIEKAKYYLEHGDERERIATNGYLRTLREHTWRHRIDEMFNFIAKKEGTL